MVMPGFYMVVGDLNLGPLAFIASSLIHEAISPSPLGLLFMGQIPSLSGVLFYLFFILQM